MEELEAIMQKFAASGWDLIAYHSCIFAVQFKCKVNVR